MEQARCARVHGVLVVAEMRQRLVDEGVEVGQGLVAVERPAQVGGVRIAEAGDAGGLDAAPQRRMVVAVAPVGRHRGGARPGLAVLGVEVPAPALRARRPGHQDAVALAQVAVEGLHGPPLPFAEEGGGFVAPGEEMRAVDRLRGDGEAGGVVGELAVEAPFVGFQIFEALAAVAGDQRVEVVRQRLAVGRVVDGEVVHGVAGGPQARREGAHGGEDGEDLLRVVEDVVGFLAHLHEHVADRRVGAGEPGMLRVELVAEDQAQGARHARLPRWRRQRSEQ